ncbi:MAG TPA: hypothetical protein VI072_25875 [Polyangiaceae bacterium]
MVSNSGGFDALVGDVSSAGLGLAAPFSRSGGTCASGGSVPPNSSCTLEIAFAPTALAFTADRIELPYTWTNGQPRGTARPLVGNAVGTAVEISAGGYHMCARTPSNGVRCWGDGVFGPLGYGNSESVGDDEFPGAAGAVSVGGSVVQLDAHYAKTCAVLSSGALRCWGLNSWGELGYGHNAENIGDDELPSTAGDALVGGTVVRVAVGHNHVCAQLSAGNVRCWGYGAAIGHATSDFIGDDEPPSSAGDVNVGGTVVQLVSGSSHVCALLNTGKVRCWGYNGLGQLGYGHTNDIGDNEFPSSAGDVNVGGNPVQLTAGSAHTCALLDTGNVRCWGANAYGQLGHGHTNIIGDGELPAAAGDVPVGGRVVQIEAGGEHTCAVLDTGGVRCWGKNAWGALGYGHTNSIGDDELPSAVGDVSVGGSVTQVAAGEFHTCALLTTGRVKCWGSGVNGLMGHAARDSYGDNELPSSYGPVPLY